MKREGEKVFIKLLTPDDVSPAYLEWMLDDQVVQYMESRWSAYTLEDLREFVRRTNKSGRDFLCGIYWLADGRHIGNIKLGNVNYTHRFGDLGLFIGDKTVWGQGCGTEAISLLTSYAFEDLNLHKIFAGIYANNQSSLKAFLKAGYKEAGRLTGHYYCAGQYVDALLMEKFREGMGSYGC